MKARPRPRIEKRVEKHVENNIATKKQKFVSKSFETLFGKQCNYTGRAKDVYKCIRFQFDSDDYGIGLILKQISDVIARSPGNNGEGENAYLNPTPRFYSDITDKLYTFNTGTPTEYDRPFGGWVKFKVNGYSEDDDIFRTHLVAYHGTSPENIQSILKNGLKTPKSIGKEPEHGDALREEGEERGNRVYLSPCINYSAHPVYSPLHKLKSQDLSVRKQFIQFVLQVRVAPNSYTAYGSTLDIDYWPEDCSFDPAFEPDSIYEWATHNPPVVTGLFVRILGNESMKDIFGNFASLEFKDEYDWISRFSKRVKNIYNRFR